MNTLKNFAENTARRYNAYGEQNPTFNLADTYKWAVTRGLPNIKWEAGLATDNQILNKFSEKTGFPVKTIHKQHYYLQELFNPTKEYKKHRLMSVGGKIKKYKTRKR